ncbi:MAG: TA system VapC family ribonuclease toxin [Pyrinomonadaceae bacterium]
MRSLLDINILLALHDPDHVHSEAAHDWWSENSAEGWASCPISENGFVRICSGAVYSPRLGFSVDQCIGLLRAFQKEHDHEFWPDTVSLSDFNIFSFDRIVGPRQLTDVYMLALAVINNGRLVTFDRRVQLDAVVGAVDEHIEILGHHN